MAKRFTDTELYEKDWFVALSPEQKLFWHYITSKCDTAGIWDVNIITACRIIGIGNIDINDFATACNSDGKERIIVFANGRKIFITTTIAFQYGANLNAAIPAHRGVISSISAHKETSEWLQQQLDNSLITLTQPLLKGCVTLKDKDKDKDIYIDLDKEKGVIGEKEEEGPGEIFTPTEEIKLEFYPFDEFWNDYDKKVGDKEKLRKKWQNICVRDRKIIKDHIPKYKLAQPDKQYRKNPETYLNQKSWNDEIIARVDPPTLRGVIKKGTSLSELEQIRQDLRQ